MMTRLTSLGCSKKPVARMTGHMQPVNHVAFSPDGSMIASASFDKSVKIWDGRTGYAHLNGGGGGGVGGGGV